MVEDETRKLLRLIVKTMRNETHTVEVTAATSINALKQIIKGSTDVDEDRQRLIYRGRVLVDERAVQDYNIEDGHIVHMVAKPENFRELKQAAAEQSAVQPLTLPLPRAAPPLTGPVARVDSAVGADLPVPSVEQDHSLESLRQGLLTMRTLQSTMEPIHQQDRVDGDGVGQYHQGQWLDVRDTVAQWLEATVLDVDHTARRLFVHYNAWPSRWDEWIDFGSPRLAPFRSRTLHASSAQACPVPAVWPTEAPLTGINDIRSILPELARSLRLLTNMVELAAGQAQRSLSVESPPQGLAAGMPWAELVANQRQGNADAEQQLHATARSLTPLVDRAGRVLMDLSPHLWELSEPGALAMQQQAATQHAMDPFQSLEARFLSLLRERPPSPPPMRAYRSPINAQRTPDSNNSTGISRSSMAPASTSLLRSPIPGAAPQHVDIHIAIVSPPREPDMASIASAMSSLTNSLAARAAAITQLNAALNQSLAGISAAHAEAVARGADRDSAVTDAVADATSSAVMDGGHQLVTADDDGDALPQLNDLIPAPSADTDERQSLMPPHDLGGDGNPVSPYWTLPVPNENQTGSILSQGQGPEAAQAELVPPAPQLPATPADAATSTSRSILQRLRRSFAFRP